MYHIFALVTLGAYLIFMLVTWIGTRLGLIEIGTISWYEQGLVSKQRLIHTWYAMVVMALVLIAFILAPVGIVIKVLMLCVYFAEHVSLKDVQVPAPWGKIGKWACFVLELAFLAFLVLI